MRIEVKFTVNLPEDANDDQITEWLEFGLQGGSMKMDNPLSTHDIEADSFSIDWS